MAVLTKARLTNFKVWVRRRVTHEANLQGLAFGGIKFELVSDRPIKEVIKIPLVESFS